MLVWHLSEENGELSSVARRVQQYRDQNISAITSLIEAMLLGGIQDQELFRRIHKDLMVLWDYCHACVVPERGKLNGESSSVARSQRYRDQNIFAITLLFGLCEWMLSGTMNNLEFVLV